MRQGRRQFLQFSAATAAVGMLPKMAWAAANWSATSGVPLQSLSYVAQDIAIVKGFMSDGGLDLTPMTVGGGATLRDLLASGQIEFGIADAAHPLLLSNRGRPSKILLSMDTRSPLSSVVIRQELFDQGIDTIEKLAKWRRPDGSKPVFGVTSLGGGQHVYLSYMAEKLGVEDDFIWIAGGGSGSILGGLSTNQFDAIAAMPNIRFTAEERGWGQVAFDVGNDEQWNSVFGGSVPSTVAFTLQSTIDKNPEMVQAYVDGLYRALQWLEQSTSEELYETVAELYLGDFEESAIRKEMEFLEPIHSYSGSVDEDNFNNLTPILFREMTAIEPIEYEDAIDASFLENAKRKFGG